MIFVDLCFIVISIMPCV